MEISLENLCVDIGVLWVNFFFSGNDALDKAVKSSEANENFQRYPQATGRLVSFTRNFLKNIQNEIEKSQQGPR